jgi:pimeloyl-ACP methyl ester carboxylesterase
MITRANASKALGIAMSLLGVLALGVVVTPTAEASRGGPPVPRLDWRPCGEDLPGKLCATARVPLDHDEPRGRTTELALAKVPASDPSRRIGTVFVNPGGPGGSGVEFVLFGFGDFLAANLDGRFDVVGFDPRGVGSSDPLHCFDSEEDLDAFLADQPVFPYRRAQERPFFDHYRSLASECLDDRQAVARHMSTADVARDLDLLRRAVGDSRLTYLGFSYGSYLGNTYANLFPGRIRALVIDGVLDPRLWSSGWQIKSDRKATQAVFDEALRLCDAAGSSCAFSARGGSRARWRALANQIRREPLVVDPEFTYTYDLLIADATGAMYAPEVWPDYFTFLDEVADAVLGDQQPGAALSATRDSVLDRLAAPSTEADYPNFFDAYYGNHCADTEYPRRFVTYRAIGIYAEQGSRFGPYWWWSNAGCADWPTSPDRYLGPWTARTSAPVLVVGNYYDPSTDYAGAQASDRLLRNSRLLTYAGWGHTAYGRSECTTAYVDRYLLTGALPRAGTVCPANPNPFTAVADRRQPRQVLVGLPPSRPGSR